MLAGVNDKNRRNGVARGDTTCPHDRAWLEHDRKGRLMANPTTFGPHLPVALEQLKPPMEAQMARAAAGTSGLDQPGKAVCTRFDVKMGRGAVTKSGAVAVPTPAVPTRPPVATNLTIPELADDTVTTALDLAADLDKMEVLIKEARAALAKGSRPSAVQARTIFAKGLACVAKQHLLRSGQNVDGAEVATPALTEPALAPAAVEPVATLAWTESEVPPAPAAVEPASQAAPTNQLPPNWIAHATTNENRGDGEVGRVYYHNATTGSTQRALPMHNPRVAATTESANCDDAAMQPPEPATAGNAAAAVSGAAPSGQRKPKASSSTLTNAKRSSDTPTFATHNSSSNHPCSCGGNHMPIRPTIGDKVRLRRVAGRRAVVTGSVVAVKGDVATVQLDANLATALKVRACSEQHANIVYSVSVGRCTETCLRTVKNMSVREIGNTAKEDEQGACNCWRHGSRGQPEPHDRRCKRRWAARVHWLEQSARPAWQWTAGPHRMGMARVTRAADHAHDQLGRPADQAHNQLDRPADRHADHANNQLDRPRHADHTHNRPADPPTMLAVTRMLDESQ